MVVLGAEFALVAAALFYDKGGVFAAHPCCACFVVGGGEQGEAVVEGGHQAVGADSA